MSHKQGLRTESKLLLLCASLFTNVISRSVQLDGIQVGATSVEIESHIVAHVSHKRENKDYPSGPNGPWSALGDSYSAGPGAGDVLTNTNDQKCKRSSQSYPQYLQQHWPGTGLESDHPLTFLSCTGVTIDDVQRNQIPKIKGGSYATLSVSANDVGLPKVLTACIAGLPIFGSCDTVIAKAYETLYSEDLYTKYKGLVTSISGKLGSNTAHPTLFQTSYPQFFNSWTRQCNDVTFGPVSGFDPHLTTALREQITDFQTQLNTVIALWIAEINTKFPPNSILYTDQDEYYNTHRFCEYPIKEPSYGNSQIWFNSMRYKSGKAISAQSFAGVNTSTCAAQSGNEIGLALQCGVAAALKSKSGSTVSSELGSADPNVLAKDFHPTDEGHAGTATALSRTMHFVPKGSHPVPLRILAVGDSITYGYKSSDKGGYRSRLYAKLAAAGYDVTFVGPYKMGPAPADHHLGLPGNRTIDLLPVFIRAFNTYKPNLVLYMAGTNDVHNRNVTLDVSMKAIVDTLRYVFENGSSVGASVIISHIPPVGAQKDLTYPLSQSQKDRIIYNAALTKNVNALRDGITTLSGQPYQPLSYKIHKIHSSIDFGSRNDSLHPNDNGYQLLANDFFEGIYEIEKRGYLTPPVSVGSTKATASTETTQSTEPSTKQCDKPTWVPEGQIANGAGLGRDFYDAIKCSADTKNSETCNCRSVDGRTPAYSYPKQTANCSDYNVDHIHAIHFADIDGDGRAEYLRVDEDGSIKAFYNQGPKYGDPQHNAGSHVSWWDAGVIMNSVGAKRHEVYFADLNGDGRAEYIWVHANGSMSVWLNKGKAEDGKTPANVDWEAQGLVASGIGKAGPAIRFADLNGDGRAEYLALESNGAATVYLNLGPKTGTDPKGANVGWMPQKRTITGIGADTRDQITFADINGDGRDDYVQIESSGAMKVWLSGTAPDNGPHAGERTWLPQGRVTTGDGTPGKNVVLGDINGDGRSDYLEIDADTSAVKAYHNNCA